MVNRLRSASGLLGFAALAVALVLGPSACGSEVDCAEGKACDDSFRVTIIPGGRGFEIGTYHFDIVTADETFATDCYITGSPEATMCDPLIPLDSTAERPSFSFARDDEGAITSFEVAFASAPESVQIRVLFGNETLADVTYTDYEEVRIDPSCPVLCEQLDEELTVLP